MLHGCVQLGSLGFSPEISYLTFPQLRNVPGKPHFALRDQIQGHVSFVWEMRFGVTCDFSSLEEQCQYQLLTKQVHASCKPNIRKMQWKLMNTRVA